MIVGKIWDCEYPWDVRVEKVTSSLVGAGHEVHLFCRNRNNAPVRERLDGMEIHRMPAWSKAGRWIAHITSFPAFVNPRWIVHLYMATREAGVDVLLCRDLPLAPVALWIGRRLRVPVVVDIAEDYPAMLRHRFHWRDFRIHNLVVRNPYLARLVERYVIRRADALLVVVEESAARLMDAGVPSSRIDVVCNTPTAARIQECGEIGARRNGIGSGSLRMAYLGLLGHSRGIETVLRALALLRDGGTEVKFDVVGPLEEGRNLPALARRLGIDQLVSFHGRMPYDKALRLVASCDLGIVPHHASEHWRTTIPNKLFDYMASSMPVIVSDTPPAKRIVETTGCGVVFRDRDPSDLCQQIRRLLDGELRETMGRAGRRAVLEYYNWQQDSARMVARLEALACEGAPPA